MLHWILTYWMQTAVIASTGLVVALAGWVHKRIIGIHNGVLALLHNRLYETCERHIQDGWIVTEEINELEHLYEAYSALGGNGTCENLYKRCCALPHGGDKNAKA